MMKTLKGNAQQGLWGATLGFFFGFTAVVLFGSTAGIFKELLKLDPVLVGLLVAAPSLSGSLLRIPFAAWVDTTGGRKPFLILMILSVIGMLGLFLVVYFLYPEGMSGDWYPLLILLGILSGCGITTFSVGIGQVSYWFPQKSQGMVLGFYAGVGNLAPGIFSFLLPLALVSWGLTGSYFIWLLFLVMGTVLYVKLGANAWYFQLRDMGYTPDEAKQIAQKKYGQEIFPKGNLKASLALSAKRWKTWALVVIYFTTFGGFMALTAWLPTYWQSFFSFSVFKAGALTAFFSMLASLIRIAGGKIADKYTGEKTAIVSLLVIFVGSLLMSQSKIFFMSLGAITLIAIGMGMANAAVFKLVPQEVPDAVGGASGWVGGLGAFGGFVFPLMMGMIIRNEGSIGYAHGFYVLSVFTVISLASAYLLMKYRVKAFADTKKINLELKVSSVTS